MGNFTNAQKAKAKEQLDIFALEKKVKTLQEQLEALTVQYGQHYHELVGSGLAPTGKAKT